MGKAGGIIGIIAGVFGIIAALVTLLFGGIGAAVGAQSAGTVVGLGWGGVFFSFLTIVCGAVAFARPMGAGIGLVISSILGIILGGTLVALFMALSLIGGILAILGARNTSPAPAAVSDGAIPGTAPVNAFAGGKIKPWLIGGTGLIVAVAVFAAIGWHSSKGLGDGAAATLENTPASALRPNGELASMYALGSDNTALQRENKLAEIKGQVVQWTLPVYEVKRSGEGYKIQTSGSGVIGTFVHVIPRNPAEQKLIEGLKTDDMVSFKGTVFDMTMRHLEINPAIIVTPVLTQAATAPVPDTPARQAALTPAEMPAPAQSLAQAATGDNTAMSQNAPPPSVIAAAPALAATQAPKQPENSLLGRYAVSFDCAKAVSVVEKLICANTTIGELDGLLSATYRDRLSNRAWAVDTAKLKSEQRRWLASRNACADATYLENAYLMRLAHVCNVPAASGARALGDCDAVIAD